MSDCNLKVSVVIPMYNAEAYIKQAMDSALSQEIPCELIVVDDCSKDAGQAIVEAYAKNYPDRVIYHRNATNLGVAKSRNQGVQLARGEYIAFLDADDWWGEGKLAAQVEAMEESGAVLSGTARELVTAAGESMGRVIGVEKTITYKDLLKTNSLSCSSVLLQRDVALEFPMEHDELHEDYYTWLRILKKYGFASGVNVPYLKSRMSEGGKSRNKLQSAKMHFGVYRLVGVRGIKALYYFLCYAFCGMKKYHG